MRGQPSPTMSSTPTCEDACKHPPPSRLSRRCTASHLRLSAPAVHPHRRPGGRGRGPMERRPGQVCAPVHQEAELRHDARWRRRPGGGRPRGGHVRILLNRAAPTGYYFEPGALFLVFRLPTLVRRRRRHLACIRGRRHLAPRASSLLLLVAGSSLVLCIEHNNIPSSSCRRQRPRDYAHIRSGADSVSCLPACSRRSVYAYRYALYRSTP